MAIEDFSAYTEVDPGDDIVKTETRITWTNLPRNLTSLVYDDKGVDHFDGNFTHLITVCLTATDIWGFTVCWMLANEVNDYQSIDDGGGDLLAVSLNESSGGTDYRIFLRDVCAGALSHDNWNGVVLNTPYYLKIKRDESVGEFGTLYCYIYSDRERTDLLATLTVPLDEKEDYRYVYGCSSNRNGTAFCQTAYSENLDLQPLVLHEKEISEGIALGEVLLKQPGKIVSEGVVLGEVLIKSINKAPFVEGIALGEVLERVYRQVRVLTEGIAIGEVLEKQAHKIISEGVALGEVLKKAITKSPFVDGLAVGEVLTKGVSRVITEGIAIGEVLTKTIPLVITDGIAIGEELFRMWVHPAIRTLSPVRVKDAIRRLLKERQL
jgi:hypothetical protein